jgi:hypothetical protein
MKIYTSEQLFSSLDDDIVWRKRELALLKSIAVDGKSQPRQETLIRSGIALLYAHWEGFVKFSASAYLDYISKRRFPYEQLNSNFIAVKIMQEKTDGQTSRKFIRSKDIVDFILTGLNEKCELAPNIINTRSNLNSEVLKEIVSIIGLDYSPFATKEKLIDEQLVANRNSIAHGRYLMVDLEEYFGLEKEILALMGIFKDQIDNAVVLQSYLKNKPI